MASGAQPSVAALATMHTDDRLDGRMELNTPHISNADTHQNAMRATTECPLTLPPRSCAWHWIRLALLGVPFAVSDLLPHTVDPDCLARQSACDRSSLLCFHSIRLRSLWTLQCLKPRHQGTSTRSCQLYLLPSD